MRTLKQLLPFVPLTAALNNNLAIQPDPKLIKVVRVTYGGNGCSSNTAQSFISSDKTDLTYDFDDFAVFTGPGVSPADKTKNCQLQTTIESPEGFSFAISNVLWRGVAAMESWESISVYSRWSMEEVSTAKEYAFTIRGGNMLNDGYMFVNSTTVPAEEMVWSRCDGTQTFTFNSRVAVTSTRSSAVGYIGYPELPRLSYLQVGLKWRECAT
jgi:hypothetical protein